MNTKDSRAFEGEGSFSWVDTIKCFAVIISMLLIQKTPFLIALPAGAILIIIGIFAKKPRTLLFTIAFLFAGYSVWACISKAIYSYFQNSPDYAPLSLVAGRLGLAGYLLPFGIWAALDKTKISTLHAGDFKAPIYFPLIWKGRKETTTSFLLIFCGIFAVPILVLAFNRQVTLQVILYGLLFSLVNSVLEEILWRGLILPRMAEMAFLPVALVASALTFGVYHLSLGFPFWACMLFSIGGFYMGGIALTSRGLAASVVMHITVNMMFVMAGMIF